MAKNIYQTFRRFLRDNGCERQFDVAFYEQCGANVLDEILADILVIDEGFFGRVFRWDLTPEGRQNRSHTDACNPLGYQISPSDYAGRIVIPLYPHL